MRLRPKPGDHVATPAVRLTLDAAARWRDLTPVPPSSAHPV